ncbi:MFS transporter, OFA family, oxalate/formate antiporter [Pseudobutyrivibrio sp. JW11]|uniref:MFS transporter n=1 Tax=Pseudobutyrivibrio sp. JW11 TaxID=1855302 RepID=UPI0008F3DFC0|nr:MFS transporter [Pseudobutyrivibrio sp. JW11]SFO38585.1 MFS transporter, OFA family, oxalate/formate antiporter [Pseudobutyrivibrio sp. JW11]
MNKTNRWIYAIAGVIVLLFAGLIYAWSVLSSPIAAEFTSWSKGALSLTFTLAMSFFCIGGLVAGLVADKVKTRYIFIASAVLFLIGFELVSMISSIGMLYLGFGVLAGLGAGFSYNAVMGSVTKWFPDKKGLISGILLMGFGIGAFIIGKVYAALLSSFGWRAEFKALGIIVFAVILIGAFIVRKPTAEEQKVYAVEDKETKKNTSEDFTTLEMVSKVSFWLYFVYAILLSAAALALIAQASGIVTETAPALAAGSIATIVGLISVFNGIGRVIFGGLYDKLGQKKTMLLNCGLFLVSVLINIVAINSVSLPLVVIGFIFFGLSYGGVTPTNSAYIMDFYGVKNYPVNFSIINLNLLLASFGGTLAGMIYDMQGTYLSIFMIMIGAIVLATICTLLIKRPAKGK